VEDALQPAHELRLGDAQLGVGRRLALGERQGDPLQLLPELRRQPLLQLTDRRGMDVAQPVAARVVQRRRADLLEQLLDHGADPHDLRRLLHHLADGQLPVPVAVAVAPHRHRADRSSVGTHDDDLLRALVAVSGCGHAPHPASSPEEPDAWPPMGDPYPCRGR
jgi:hypothetical protein